MEFMNIGYSLAIVFLVASMISGYWGIEINNKKEKNIPVEIDVEEQNTAISYGQQGGITTGKVEVKNIVNQGTTLKGLDTTALTKYLSEREPEELKLMVIPDLFSMELQSLLQQSGWDFGRLVKIFASTIPVVAKIEIYDRDPSESMIFLNDWLNSNGFDSVIITDYVRYAEYKSIIVR